MEILQLKYFCDAAVCQNFSQTAQKFMIPPSCVSASVKRLEKELGVNLFDRSANKAVLNENGKKFLHATSLALNLLEGAVREIKTGEQVREIKLLVACNRRVVTSCIEKFREQNPDVSFSLTHQTDKSFFDFDMIISDTTIPEASEQILLFKEPMLLAVNRKNPLAEKPEILAKDLENEKFITMHKGSSLSRITEVLCAKAGFSPNISIESDDPYYIRKYIEMGLGVGFVPAISWEGMLPESIVLRKVWGMEYERNTYLIFPKPLIHKHHIAFSDLLMEFCDKYKKTAF